MNLWENTPGHCEEIPALTYYPAKNKKSDAAIVIFPGGAYECRAPHEGQGYAEFLNEFGYDAFVCDYRVSPHRFPLELLDARRAVRTVRYYADKYGINKSKVVVMGSSAGGNLVSLLSTFTQPIDYEGVDDIDKEDFLPNGQILCYPVVSLADEKLTHVGSKYNLLGDKYFDKGAEWSAELNVKSTTAPAFIWHTAEDTGVNVINSYVYATALRNANVPTELHVFPFGGHGLGAAPGNKHVAQWTGLLNNWLELMFS